MAACTNCGFIFNQSFDSELLSYNETYDNTQEFSPTFREHTDALANHLIHECGIQNHRVIEIGCGKGAFLRKLIDHKTSKNVGLGIDPSYKGLSEDCNGRLRFDRDYYGPKHTNVPADVIICRHVIEHISRPITLLSEIRKALASSPTARVFFETPTSEWILDQQAIWDFFYEHCSLFSIASLTHAFTIAGFQVDRIHHVFGDQYIWLEATVAPPGTSIANQGSAVAARAAQFGIEDAVCRHSLATQLRYLRSLGKIALWGAGAKGVTFANLLDPDRRYIDSVVDINPPKQGCYLPGTGHPIIGPNELHSRNIVAALVLNPEYYAEISAILAREQIPVRLFHIPGSTAKVANMGSRPMASA